MSNGHSAYCGGRPSGLITRPRLTTKPLLGATGLERRAGVGTSSSGRARRDARAPTPEAYHTVNFRMDIALFSNMANASLETYEEESGSASNEAATSREGWDRTWNQDHDDDWTLEPIRYNRHDFQADPDGREEVHEGEVVRFRGDHSWYNVGPGLQRRVYPRLVNGRRFEPLPSFNQDASPQTAAADHTGTCGCETCENKKKLTPLTMRYTHTHTGGWHNLAGYPTPCPRCRGLRRRRLKNG